MTETIGFIGLGAMGGGMASNLLKAGYALVVNDLDGSKVEALCALGARPASTAAAAARQSACTITMVETTAQTEEVILGADGLINGASRGHVVAMMSTIDPNAAKRLNGRLADAGIAMLDAPVSGGSARAQSGELSVIAGGDRATFERCRPIFAAMSSHQFHVGGCGQGLALKLVNNMLIQVNTVAIAEAFVMGAKAGLDPTTMYEVIRVSTGASFALEGRLPRMLAGDSGRAAPSTFPTRTRSWKRPSPNRWACRCCSPMSASRSIKWRGRPASAKRTAPRSSRSTSGWPA